MTRPAAGGQTKKAAAENIDAILPLEKQDEETLAVYPCSV
jgi:hypothetical protein